MRGQPGEPPRADALAPVRLRAEFPIFAERIHGQPLVYLDSAASAQKPLEVLEALERFYRTSNSNVHRGVHELSARATDAFEGAREAIRRFIGAREPGEIVFTRGTTEGINLVAASYGAVRLGRGDEILISAMEHHSNIVPWQLLCERVGATLRVAPIDAAGELIPEAFERLVGPRTRLVAVTHVSNVLGTRNPVEWIARTAHAHGAVVLIDGAQGVVHEPLDVRALDCDFYAFSGHKLYGPTGIGVLYGKAELLREMVPYQGGGEMIRSVSFERTTYNDPPHRFEAGTPDIAGAIGLGAAVDFLERVGRARIAAAEAELLEYATGRLGDVPGIRLYGAARQRSGVLSFNLGTIHAHDVGTVLDHAGIAVRAGHHCAQPLMDLLGVPATVRASLGCYNVREDIDALVRGLHRAREVFA